MSDHRDEVCLNRDLVILRQPNVRLQKFYDKVLHILIFFCSHLNIHVHIQAVKSLKKKLSQDLALKAFLSELRNPLGTTIGCMRRVTLSETLQLVLQEENPNYFQTFTNKQGHRP